MTAEEDYKLQQYGIGFTNMVQRPTKGSADLTRKEIKEGSRVLLDKIRKFQPKIAVFNGKLIFEVFSGKKDFCFGKQPECVEGTNTVSIAGSERCLGLYVGGCHGAKVEFRFSAWKQILISFLKRSSDRTVLC